MRDSILKAQPSPSPNCDEHLHIFSSPCRFPENCAPDRRSVDDFLERLSWRCRIERTEHAALRMVRQPDAKQCLAARSTRRMGNFGPRRVSGQGRVAPIQGLAVGSNGFGQQWIWMRLHERSGKCAVAASHKNYFRTGQAARSVSARQGTEGAGKPSGLATGTPPY